MINGVVIDPGQGCPQGCLLIPLLSNIMLDELDKELERRGHRFVRHAGDVNIYLRSKKAAERTLKSITTFIGRRLKLKVNRTKSVKSPGFHRDFEPTVSNVFSDTFSLFSDMISL